MADQLLQTLPLFGTFLVCQISLVVNIVESCGLIELYSVHSQYVTESTSLIKSPDPPVTHFTELIKLPFLYFSWPYINFTLACMLPLLLLAGPHIMWR